MDLNLGQVLAFSRFRLDTSSGLLYRDGVAVTLGSRARALLVLLVERAGEVLSHRELERAVWSQVVDDSNLRAQVVRLRRVLDDGAEGRRYIANVARRGYSFVGEVERVSVE